EAEAREMRIVAREIRRVAHDAVERASAQRGEPVGLEPLDVEPEPLAVLARDRERLGARIDAEDDRIAPLVLDRERERTAAGAEIEHARPLDARKPRERGADEMLGLR